MRALVLGGEGMLGRSVVERWRSDGEPVLGVGRGAGDLRDAARLREVVDAFAPDVVINCAAFTRVDDCESERDLAMEVNGRAVGHAVAAAVRCGARFVHVSSDYVFDGEPGDPRREDDETGPISTYGESKLLGEQEAARHPDALVVRTSWLFGPSGSSFPATMLRLIREGRVPLRVVDDQVGCPTYTPFLARAVRDLLRVGASGIVHYANREAVSWHAFASEIARQADPAVEVHPVSTAEFPRPARRPAYSALDTTRFEDLVGRPVETWSAGLALYLERLGAFR